MAPHDASRPFRVTWYEWSAGRSLQRQAVIYATDEARAHEKAQRTLRADGRHYSGLFVRLARDLTTR